MDGIRQEQVESNERGAETNKQKSNANEPFLYSYTNTRVTPPRAGAIFHVGSAFLLKLARSLPMGILPELASRSYVYFPCRSKI